MLSASDGGRAALAGYLYQLVGTQGVVALSSVSGIASDNEQLEALVQWARTGDAFHEFLDQDLGIHMDDGCVLVQFKYSRLDPLPSIGRKELLDDIVAAFSRSTHRAKRLGAEVTGYVLVTNRPIGHSAREIEDAAKADNSQPGLTRSQLEILRQLRTITKSMSEWKDSLKTFAYELGVYEAEVEDRIHYLVGQLTEKTANSGDAHLSIADIKYGLTGYRGTRPLTVDHVTESCVASLKRFSGKLGLCGQPVRRDLLDEIQASASERALVVLSGVGGCGKTVALWQLAKEMADQSVAAPIAIANTFPGLWIANTISDWADLPEGHPRRGEQIRCAMRRLLVANPDAARPIACWALDGLDEVTEGSDERRQAIRKVLNWFWEEDQAAQREPRSPQATLVVTCREGSDLADKWLTLDLSGFGSVSEVPLPIEVGDFTPDELLEAARNALPIELVARIRQAFQPVAGSATELRTVDRAVLPRRPKTPYTAAAHHEVIEALQHPALWRAFLDLDPADQSRVLDGEHEAMHQLAAVYVSRFCNKVLRRGQIVRLDRDTLLDALHAIARHCDKDGRSIHQYADWVKPVGGLHYGLALPGARTLYQEAISGGMIVRSDARRWYWRHDLVRDYLTQADRAIGDGEL